MRNNVCLIEHVRKGQNVTCASRETCGSSGGEKDRAVIIPLDGNESLRSIEYGRVLVIDQHGKVGVSFIELRPARPAEQVLGVGDPPITAGGSEDGDGR